MTPKIAAIILNYKHLQDTANCLANLIKTDSGKKVEYFVVDNSPDAGNEDFLISQFPHLTYLKSPRNLGFAGGNNQGVQKALSFGFTHILIINPDVTVGYNFFIPLMKHFADKKVGLVAPAILHTQKGKKTYGLEGRVNWGFAKPEHRNLPTLKEKNLIVSEFVTFACVLISQETFQKAGLLDDGYFMYFEDVDYCLAVGRAGMKILLDPQVVVSHRTSSSFARPIQKLGLSFRSHLRFINKWLPPLKRIRPYLYVLILYPYLYFLWTYHDIKYSNGK